MILAQALQRHLLGPDWRWPAAGGGGVGGGCGGVGDERICSLLRLFWDTPAGGHAACSVPLQCQCHSQLPSTKPLGITCSPNTCKSPLLCTRAERNAF